MTAEAATKTDLQAEMRAIGQAARAAAAELALVSAEAKSKALLAAAAAMRQGRAAILAANARDMAAAEQKKLTSALLDRRSRPFPIPSVRCWRSGRGPTASSSSVCACRSASSASSTSRGRT